MKVLLLVALFALLLSQQQDTHTYVVNPTGVMPSPMHLTLLDMVERCLEHEMTEPLRWAVADSIIMAPSGTLAYGLYLRQQDGLNAIFIERPYWFHPTVITHELTHAIARAAESSLDMATCVVRLDPPLPLRETEHLDGLEGRDNVLRINHRDDQ